MMMDAHSTQIEDTGNMAEAAASGSGIKEKSEESYRAFKVCNADQSRKVGIVARTFVEFKGKCQEKFHLFQENMRFVLATDGTEVDSEFLWTVPGELIMILLDDEIWPPSVTPASTGSLQNADVTMSLIQTLREENKRNRRSGSSKQLLENKAEKNLQIHVGWMNFSYRDRKYKLIKGSRDRSSVGPRTMKIACTATFSEIETQLRAAFFPNGRSHIGRESNFSFSVGNFDGQQIRYSKTLKDHVAGSFSKTRVYLLSKERPTMTITSSDSDTELPAFHIRAPQRTITSQEANLPDLEDDFLNTPDMLGSNNLTVTENSATGGDNSTVTNYFAAQGQQASATSDSLSAFVEAGTPTVSLKSRLCIVCYDREPTAYYFPCGHTSCLPCALHIYENSVAKKCPNCRNKIDGVRNIYNDN